MPSTPPPAGLTYAAPNDPLLKRWFIHAIEWGTGRALLERKYQELNAESLDDGAVWSAALDALEVSVAYDRSQLASITKEEPLVLVANHPFGVLDGLIMGYMAAQLRPDFQILTNSVLCDIEQVKQHLLPIDFSATKAAIHTNIATKNQAVATLKEGGAVVVFPGGGVATTQGWWGPAREFPWKPFVAKLVHVTQATVVPFYFQGQNSRLFQVVSQYSLTLRLAMLLHEVRNKMGQTIRVTVGDAVSHEVLMAYKKRLALTDHLYKMTLALGHLSTLDDPALIHKERRGSP